MDYQKIYNKIIENRKNNPLSKDIYGEKHHIIPKCLGGDNKKENLVKLTAREHFLCHYCLVKIYEGKAGYHKMLHAFMIMKAGSQKGQRYLNSRLYDGLKQKYSKQQSIKQSGKNNSSFGTCWINKNLINKKISNLDLDFYLLNGWVKGRCLNEKQIKESLELRKIKLEEKTKKISIKLKLKEEQFLIEKKKFISYYEIYKKYCYLKFLEITGLKMSQRMLIHWFKKYIDNFDSEIRKNKKKK